jgi:hypothetical protein
MYLKRECSSDVALGKTDRYSAYLHVAQREKDNT